MDRLLIRYCNLIQVKPEDIKGKSHANGLPAYRHIFYYCIKTRFSNVKLRHIAAIVEKKPSGVGYGIKVIADLIKPIVKAGGNDNFITPQIQAVKDLTVDFLNICKEYKESEIKLTEK